MDPDLAVRELNAFISMSSGAPRQASFTVDLGGGVIDSPETELVEQAVVVERILMAVTPHWQDEVEVLLPETRWDELREAAIRARGLLRREADLRKILGDNAPEISAAELHPWVWEGARPLWVTGNFGEAVDAATRKLQAETQRKLGRRDVSGAELFEQAFSTSDAEPGRPRLRRMSDDGSDTYRSKQVGAIALGKALFTGIRNPLSHEADELFAEQEALESLAAISILARWVDQSELITVEEAP